MHFTSKTAAMERTMRTIRDKRLPLPAKQAVAILEAKGHEPARCQWRVNTVKKRLGIVSRRARKGRWYWTTREIEKRAGRESPPLSDSLLVGDLPRP